MLLFNQFAKQNMLEEPAGGGGEPAPATAPAAGAAAPAWDTLVGGLPDDLKKDPSMSTIKDFPNLVKSFVNAQKAMGSKVNLPDPKHATESDYLDLFKRIGAVEKPEDFKFKLPDGVQEDKLDKDFIGKLKESAVKAGVLPWQFEKLYSAYHERVSAMSATETARWNAEVEASTNALKQEWGKGFDDQVKKANVAFKELVPNEADRQKLIKDGLGGHPVVMKLLANAAKYFKEDVFLGQGAGQFTSMTPEQALHKAKDIMGNAEHPYRVPSHPNHLAAKKEVADLFKMAYPE